MKKGGIALSKAIISTTVKGNYKKTYDFLDRCSESLGDAFLSSIGKRGVEALKENTPRDTGKTAYAWYYVINKTGNQIVIEWHNDNLTEDGHNVAILVQYGHQTKSGSWVYGRDYINPAIQPIFDKMADEMWERVVSE